jgi:hypothetical protein
MEDNKMTNNRSNVINASTDVIVSKSPNIHEPHEKSSELAYSKYSISSSFKTLESASHLQILFIM